MSYKKAASESFRLSELLRIFIRVFLKLLIGWIEDLLRFPVEFEIDYDRAFRITKVLLDLIKSGSWLVSMPEYRWPRNLMAGTREHALYLTYVISIDYMTDAENLWSKARGAYELYPERFTPEKILAVSERTLEVFLRRLGGEVRLLCC